MANKERRRFVIGLVAAAAPLVTRWDQDAEQTFRMGRGMGRQLMTEDEWKEHRAKMHGMTAEDRSRYREEMHQRMMERAKEKGLTVPQTPGPHGPKGPGPR
jgi:hypothetical protein